MFNKVLSSFLIITSCVNAMDGENGINNGLIENSSNNSKSVILTKSNNINGIMNNEKNNTNNINIDKNARNNNKDILNNNTLNIEYEKNKELSRYITNNFLDINTLPKGYMINVNNCIKLLQQNKIALEKEYDSLISKLLEQISKKEGLNEEMRKIGYKVEEIQKEINSKKKDKSKEFKKKIKRE